MPGSSHQNPTPNKATDDQDPIEPRKPVGGPVEDPHPDNEENYRDQRHPGGAPDVPQKDR